MSSGPWALALHGGAGVSSSMSYTAQEGHLAELAALGAERLANGDHALEIVTDLVAMLEESGLYVAGKGSNPNNRGDYELDASLMDGSSGKAGAVIALQGFASPVRVARAVMDHSRNVALAGEGASKFAEEMGFTRLAEPDNYFRPVPCDLPLTDPKTGTVGAVALDVSGGLAAATSTGGLVGKIAGRVGDSPIIGAGCWADNLVAVSCTGTGEHFIRRAAAHDVAARMRYGGASVSNAVTEALDEVERLGGRGGLIAVDRNGDVTANFNGPGMKRAIVTSSLPLRVETFGVPW